MGRGHGHTQVSPQEADRKTNSSKLSPRWFLYTWFIPSDPHVATPASLALPAWSYPPPPLLGAPPLTGLCLQRWGGEKRGSLSTEWLSCGLSPPERGERRKEEGSTELGFKYSRSYGIEDKITRSGEGGQGGAKVRSRPQQGHSTPRIQGARGRAGERRIWGREEPKDGPTLTWMPRHRASETPRAPELGSGGLQLGQVQFQLVGRGAVCIGVRRGRVQGPLWLHHITLVLLQSQGL